MIDRLTIDKIYNTIDIYDIVSEFVTLKRRGANYLGLCPFHNEKTPSFTVSPAKGIYKCFGCGKGGNGVNFIMEHEGLGYADALKYLAKKYNIEIEEKEPSPEDLKKRDMRESMLILSQFAADWFHEQLKNSDEGKRIGLSYFKERGFSGQTIEKFQLGYSPAKRDAFTQAAEKKGYKTDVLTGCGLTIQKEDRKFDRFSERVMFPIHSLSGQVIAFGGRIMRTDTKMAKYLNSPESDIYHKSRVLYGLFQSRKAITQFNQCILVEGYTDVISLNQSGIENVVASSGTSLTTDQIKLIKRFTNNLIVLYDGDPAGIKASLRGIDMVLKEEMNVKICLLPDGEDPDSYARANGASATKQYIEDNATDFIRFKTGLLVKEAGQDPIQKSQMVNDIVKSISIIPDGITRSIYLKECASMMDIDEKILYTEVNKIRRKEFFSNKDKQVQDSIQEPNQKSVLKPTSTFEPVIHQLERELIWMIFNHGYEKLFFNDPEKEKETDSDSDTIEYIELSRFIIDDLLNNNLTFSHPVLKKIFEEFVQHQFNNVDINPKYFVNHEDIDIVKEVVDITSKDYEVSKLWERYLGNNPLEDTDISEILGRLLNEFKRERINQLLQEKMDQLKDGGAEENKKTLEEIISLNKKKQEVSNKLNNRFLM